MEVGKCLDLFESLEEFDDQIDVKMCEVKELKKKKEGLMDLFVKEHNDLGSEEPIKKKDLKFAYKYWLEAKVAEDPQAILDSQYSLVAQIGVELSKGVKSV